jgi:phage tail-like protein
MTTDRDVQSYDRFAYRLSLVEGGTTRLLGGVHEISGLERIGGAATTVTLERGILRHADLYSWIARERGPAGQVRTLRIDRMGQDGRSITRSWQVVNARPVKYTGPVLSASGTDVAIEELTLSAEGLEIT